MQVISLLHCECVEERVGAVCVCVRTRACALDRQRVGESSRETEICRADVARCVEMDVHAHVRLDIHLR